MPPGKPLILVSSAAAALWGACLGPPADEAALLQRGGAASIGSCARCHEYPPPDRNHEFHLIQVPNTSAYPHAVSCFDCHATAIRSDTVSSIDTIYQGYFGEELRASDYPGESRIRQQPILRTEPIRRIAPRAYPGQESEPAALRMFVTAAAHMNGSVDVAMHPSRERIPAWNRERLTCSAVACHTSAEAYDLEIGPATGLLGGQRRRP